MPEIQVETVREDNETYEQTYGRLMKMVRDKKDIVEAYAMDAIVFTPMPGIQKLGNKYICRWKYKQYPH